MDIISRKDAHQQGRKKFYTGEPCKNGHLAERFTTSGACTHCAKAFHKMPPGPSNELFPMQPPLVYVPRLDVPQMDELGDYIAQCVAAWVDFKGLMTDGMRNGYEKLTHDAADKRRVRDHQVANAGSAQTLKTTATASAVVTGDAARSGAQRFLDALATMTGATLDGATELIRQQGEPDTHFRARVRTQTLKNMGWVQS